MCAEDKDRWDGMFQMDGDEADLFSALKERLKKRKEKMKKKENKKEVGGMGLQLLFGGWCWGEGGEGDLEGRCIG